MNWTETQSRLASDKGRWSHIARETGLHINAIRNIAVGDTPTPRISTVEKIIEFYEREDAGTPANDDGSSTATEAAS